MTLDVAVRKAFSSQETLIGRPEHCSLDPERLGRVLPSITGTAYVTAEATLILDDRDPLRWGIGSGPWPSASKTASSQKRLEKSMRM